jgi:hypothetical protein
LAVNYGIYVGAAKLLTKDEARRIAANIAKLLELLRANVRQVSQPAGFGAVHSSRSKIVVDFPEGGSRPGK